MTKTELDIKLTELSIKHWEENVRLYEDGQDMDLSYKSCSLCGQYWNEGGDSNCCSRCPIQKSTGKQYCEGTPYDDVDAEEAHPQEMLDFLTEMLTELKAKNDKN